MLLYHYDLILSLFFSPVQGIQQTLCENKPSGKLFPKDLEFEKYMIERIGLKHHILRFPFYLFSFENQ